KSLGLVITFIISSLSENQLILLAICGINSPLLELPKLRSKNSSRISILFFFCGMSFFSRVFKILAAKLFLILLDSFCSLKRFELRLLIDFKTDRKINK